MESVITEYLSHELSDKPELLSFNDETPLIGLIDSLSLLKLVLYVEEKFGVVVNPDDFIPENFQTVHAICTYIRMQQQVQGVKR